MSRTWDYGAEICVNGGWTSTGNDIYGHDRAHIEITMGSSSESGTSQPCRCSMTLNNRSGKYSPLNPLSPYYGSLGLNTPIRVFKRLVTAGFASTVSSAWPTTDTGESWTTFGSGGALNASDYSSSGGKGNHSVPAANAYRSTYLATPSYQTVDVKADLSLDTTNITGALVSWNVLFRGLSTSDFHRVALEVLPDESMQIVLYNEAGVAQNTPQVLTGYTHSTSQAMSMRVLVEGWTVLVKVWRATDVEPFDWSFAQFYYGKAIDPGFIGLQSRRATGNTNGTLVFSYDNFEVRSPRFSGEVSGWPNRWDVSGNDIYVPLEAAGIMRRIGAKDADVQSVLRNFISPTFFAGIAEAAGVELVGYWPLEEKSNALYGAPAVGTTRAVLTGNTRALTEHWGHGDLAPWLRPCIALYGDGQLTADIGFDPADFTAADGFRADLTMKTTGDQDWSWTIYTQSTVTASISWIITVKPSVPSVVITDTSGGTTTITGAAAGIFDSAVHTITFSAHQSGSDIVWGIDFDDRTNAYVLVSAILRMPLSWRVASAAPHTSALSVGHVCVWSAAFGSSTEIWEAAKGMVGETVVYRLARVCPPEGASIYPEGQPQTAAPLGPQSLSALSAQLDEYAKTDGGVLGDTRGTIGVAYRIVSELCSQDARLVLDYDAAEIAPGFEPDYDDQLVQNQVVATATQGGSAVAEVTTGPLSSARPNEGGAGRYTGGITVNVASDSQLQDIAGWQTSLGTVNEYRHPSVSTSSALLSSSKLHDLLQLRVGDRVDLTNLPIYQGGDTAQLVVGYTEIINRFVQEHRLYTVPESPYEVLILDDPGDRSRLAAGASFLAEDITSSATSFRVKSLDGTRWSTTTPYNIRVGGEEMTVTAVTNNVPTYVGVGTAAHADNAAVTPGLPAGATTGDLMIGFCASRNLSITPGVPTGWTSLLLLANIRFIWKIHSGGGETAPTITPSAGAAGDAFSAQLIALRNVPTPGTFTDFANLFTGSTQNVPVPAFSMRTSNGIVITCASKSDDWTSVATLFDFTEIGEPSTTLGNDNGLVWDYQIITGDISTPPDNFIVTGGAAANARAIVLGFGNWQSFAVTRSVNGVVKSHVADDSEIARVNLAPPMRLGLS